MYEVDEIGAKEPEVEHIRRAHSIEEKHWTYTDIMNMGQASRCEIHNGKLFTMARPTWTHQVIEGELLHQLMNFLKGNPALDQSCVAVPEPALRLLPKENNRDDSYLTPDIAVVSDRSKIFTEGIRGAPTLIIEILSPSTAFIDSEYKMHIYLDAGVKEFWIVDPRKKQVDVYTLAENSSVDHETYRGKVQIPVVSLTGCVLDMTPVFDERNFPPAEAPAA
jgi:Uma2 family endonuclease